MNVCPREGVAYDSYYNETDRVKMLVLPALFDSEKPEKAETHYERLNQYNRFQTKEVNIKDTTKEAIEIFEHISHKKALIWFQQHKTKFSDYLEKHVFG